MGEWPVEKAEKISVILQPPFSSTLKTKIGKEFLRLVDNYFSKTDLSKKKKKIKIIHVCPT